MGGDGFGNRQHIFQIRTAIFVRGCANGDELHIALFNCGFGVRCEQQTAFSEIGFHNGL